MIRRVIIITALITGVLITSSVTAHPRAMTQTPAQATAADATPFIGEWTLEMQGQNGPAAFDLSVKVEKDKVTSEIKGAEMPAQAIPDITKVDKSLVLSYSFDYQGSPVPTVVSLTPGTEAKMAAQIDFANGAYVMSGSATKKEKAK